MGLTVVNVFGSFLAALVLGSAMLVQQSYLIQLLLKSKIPGLATVHDFTDNSKCYTIPEAEACEKVVVHHPTGLVYAACTTLDARMKWGAYWEWWHEASPTTDYIGIYNPAEKTFRHLSLENFPDNRGLHVHGMDVVVSRHDPNVLFVYVVNHRPQLEPGTEPTLGADEAIELFTTSPGSDHLVHIKTFDDPEVLITPNDISGSSDGESFYFTNDNPSRTGTLDRTARVYLNLPSTTVGYCHIKEGCKIVATGLKSANGIVRTNDETFWVADAMEGPLSIFSRQADDSLVLIETVHVGRPVDNLVADGRGNVFAAVYLAEISNFLPHWHDPYNHRAQSAVYNVSLNTGRDAYFGEKYAVKKVFEDDGTTVNGITTAAYDPTRKLLYVTGLLADAVAVCPM